jgi:membrane protease YdiL (CAAX protease family)
MILRRSPLPGTFVFWGYDDLALFGGALLPALVLGGICGWIARQLFGIERAVEGFVLLFAAYAGWFAALYLIFRLRYEKPFWDSLSWRPSLPRMASAFVSGLGVAAGLIFVSAFLERPPTKSPMEELLGRPGMLILVGIFSTTLGPLCEELAFRGFLMPLFAETFGVAGGIVLAAIPFAIAHAPQYAYSWRHVALIGLAGIAFGWKRFRSGSTASATVMHAAYNSVIFCGLLYEKYQW